MKTVGFVGIGIMGGAMVQNLLRAGYAVQVYTRTREKAQAVLDAGAVWRDTPAACAQGAEAVFSIVGYFYVKGRGKGKFAKNFIPQVLEEPDGPGQE